MGKRRKERRNRRHERKLARIQSREKVRLGRQETRENVKTRKWEALETGYVNGIDGRQSVATAVSDSVGSVASATASIYGDKFGFMGKKEGGATDSSPMILIALFIAAIAFFNKK